MRRKVHKTDHIKHVKVFNPTTDEEWSFIDSLRCPLCFKQVSAELQRIDEGPWKAHCPMHGWVIAQHFQRTVEILPQDPKDWPISTLRPGPSEQKSFADPTFPKRGTKR